MQRCRNLRTTGLVTLRVKGGGGLREVGKQRGSTVNFFFENCMFTHGISALINDNILGLQFPLSLHSAKIKPNPSSLQGKLIIN